MTSGGSCSPEISTSDGASVTYHECHVRGFDPDGLYYAHSCSHCGRVTYDALPMLDCPTCHVGLPGEKVTFDPRKRERELMIASTLTQQMLFDL